MVQIAYAVLTAAFALFSQVGYVRSLDLATCNASAGFDWAYNSLNQSPCTVASYLGAVCNDGQYTIPAINSSEFYSGPTSQAQNECRCSSVFYSMLSACGACQEATVIAWSTYSKNCSTVYTGVYPEDIPSGTVVPHWAYLDVVSSDVFNATAAKQAGDSPESTAGAKATGASTSSSAASKPTQSSGSDSTGSSSSKSHTGAIAGGVVGGVIGLALVIAALFWFLRKRSQNKSAPEPDANVNNPNSRFLSPDFTGTSGPSTMMGSHYTVPPKLYDPSDPSTFPPTDGLLSPTGTHGTTYHGTSASMSDIGSIYPTTATAGPHRTYPGLAEV